MNRLSVWPWGKGAKNRKETVREEKVDEGKSRGKRRGDGNVAIPRQSLTDNTECKAGNMAEG